MKKQLNHLNNLVLLNRSVARFFLLFWYGKDIQNSVEQYRRQGHKTPFNEVVEGTLNVYYEIPFKLRLPLSYYVKSAKYVKPNTPIKTEPKQRRNQQCNCGSGKKYKHCHGKQNS